MSRMILTLRPGTITLPSFMTLDDRIRELDHRGLRSLLGRYREEFTGTDFARRLAVDWREAIVLKNVLVAFGIKWGIGDQVSSVPPTDVAGGILVRRLGPYPELAWPYVHPNRRREGLGELLVYRALWWLRRNNYDLQPTVLVRVRMDFPGAPESIRFFTSLGFVNGTTQFSRIVDDHTRNASVSNAAWQQSTDPATLSETHFDA